MVMMSTRTTKISMLENNKKFSTSIIGIKGDPVTAEAKDIKLPDNTKLGATNLREAFDTLADLSEQLAIDAAAAQTATSASLESLDQKIDTTAETLSKESLKNALLF